jgi:hypothetical protein
MKRYLCPSGEKATWPMARRNGLGCKELDGKYAYIRSAKLRWFRAKCLLDSVVCKTTTLFTTYQQTRFQIFKDKRNFIVIKYDVKLNRSITNY